MSDHHHHHEVSGKNLFITIALNIIITIAQILGGIVSGSLALLSDAMHNFSDVLALFIAYFANKLSSRPNSKERTFGYKRAEILAALFNASALIGIALFLVIEAIDKFMFPKPVNSLWVMGLGLLSIILNAASVLLIKDDAHDNMNIKAAYLHLLSDVLTSVAVVIGGILIYFYQIYWVDPLISVIIAFYLVWASFDLIKESSAILMQFTPKEVNLDELIKTIENEPLIKNVHHIHIWKLSDRQIHLEAHLDFNEDISISKTNEIIDKLEDDLHDKFHIEHTTFQCEYDRDDKKDKIIGENDGK